MKQFETKKNKNIRTALKSNIMTLSTAFQKYHVCEREYNYDKLCINNKKKLQLSTFPHV